MVFSQAYRRSAAEFIGVVRGLSAEQLATSVAACPAWTVHDLLAHLAGTSADQVSQNLDGVTTDPWTARQVEDRRGRTVPELATEWSTAPIAQLRYDAADIGWWGGLADELPRPPSAV